MNPLHGNLNIWRSSRASSWGAVVETFEPRFLFSGGLSPQLSDAPVSVDELFASGTAWSTQFKQHLQDRYEGSAANGYSVTGAPYPVQLPWINVNQVSLEFSRPVRAGPEDLSVRGVWGEYPVAGYRFDDSTRVATWTLARPLDADRLIVRLNVDGPGGVTDTVGRPLDGDGDNRPGGDFLYRMNVLPGDAAQDSRVNGFDELAVRRLLGRSPGDGVTGGRSYYPFSDLDGNGRINAIDLLHVRRRLYTRLPDEQPAAAPMTATPVLSITASLFGTEPILL